MMAAAGVTPDLLQPKDRKALDESGYLILPSQTEFFRSRGIELSVLRDLIDRMIVEEGWRGGIEGKEKTVTAEKPLDPGSNRLGNLVEKKPHFRAFISHPKVLAAVHHVIKAPFKCSAVDMRNPKKDGGEQQIHIDWLPRTSVDDPFECVFVGFFIDGMTIENGALRIIPGTHECCDWPNEYIDVLTRHKDEVRVEVEPGSIIVANALVWHAGACNNTGAPRRSIYVDYRNRRLGQLLNQKCYLSTNTIEDLTELERYLLAVRPEDPNDKTLSLGPGETYRARYGNVYIPPKE